MKRDKTILLLLLIIILLSGTALCPDEDNGFERELFPCLKTTRRFQRDSTNRYKFDACFAPNDAVVSV